MTSLSNSGIVSALLKLLPEWRKDKHKIRKEVEFHWRNIHLSIVSNYFSRMHAWCDFKELPSKEWFDDALIHSTHNRDRLRTRTRTRSSVNYEEVIATFTQELQEFFKVPRRNREALHIGIKKHQVMGVFISFLLQLLCNKTDLIDLAENGIENLDKELRFLRTVLGDAAILQQLCDHHEHEQVNNLLQEFEAVANEAGSLVHSLFFSTDPVSEEMDEGIRIILNHIDLLKANILKFLDDLLPLSSRVMTPTTSLVDSLLVVDSLLHDLEVLIKQEDDPIADMIVKDQILTLHKLLDIMQSSIKDIGGPQPSEIRELKELLMRIGDVACEAEYLIISFLAGDAPPEYLIIRLNSVICNIELIGTEIQEIKKNYEIGALKVAKHQLPLQANRNLEVDFVTVGLEEKEIHVLDQLVGGTEHLQIISVTGMPGIGKTTFAKKLYNHPLISYTFDRCSFCVVSQSYEKKSVLLDILNNPKSDMSKMGEEILVEHLYRSLKGRRYLVVMDDIWDSNVLDDLRRFFPDDGNGSRILITSRNKVVTPPSAVIYELPSLTNDECWDLLEKHVFRDEPCPHELQWIGKKIAANCSGLPLAVVSVAGILSGMDNEESLWDKVGQNLASFIFDGGDNTVMQILELSYKHLPEHLKRCFLYFGVFSKYREIPVQKLMRLWIAEGFIIMRKEQNKSAESVAEEYLMELIDKSVAIVSGRRSDGGIRACVVHDLLRDLCLRKCDEENFLKFVNESTPFSVLSKFHRFRDDGGSLSIFDYRHNLRSIHAASRSSIYTGNMKLLRVLNFRSKIPQPNDLFGIEFLVSLKYLCITKLPVSIGSLMSLEFLIVRAFETKVVIPSAILKMNKLRYLEVSKNAEYDTDCNNSSQINKLEFLSTVNVYSLKDEEVLKRSPHLRRLKCNYNVLQFDKEKGAFRNIDLRFFTLLESLHIKNRVPNLTAEINFPTNIKKLTLSNSGLPWEKIVEAAGKLPKLEVLKLVSAGSVDEIWETRESEFQQLKFLKLQNVGIKQWDVASGDHFPRLQNLLLINCYELQKIPGEVGEIASLQLIGVQGGCLKSLVESVEEIEEEQREMGNEELRVIIHDVHHDFRFQLVCSEEETSSDKEN